MTTDLHYLSIAEAARLMAAGRLSPVELTGAFLARIEALNPTLNAYLTITAERALEQARAAEAAIARDGPRGPLHGVPFGLKDIYDTRGIRTTAHSALLADRVPQADAACAERLAAAGAILLGKLATHEFATGGPAYDLPAPPACNPWLLDRFPGGSSSGAAAAVAAGLAPAALGSDTGGSIRLPAAYCGLAGIKPSYGRVSKRGVLPLSWTLDNCGPLTWSVEDAAIMLQAIAGHDPLDPSSCDVAVPDFRAALEEGIAGMRIGVVRHFYESDCRASDETIAAMDAAIELLCRLGAQPVDVTLAPLDDYQACYRAIMLAESFAIHAADLRAHPERFSALTRYRVLPGAFMSAADYVNALRFQRALIARARDAMRGLDALVTATTYGPAPVQVAMRRDAAFARPPLTNPFNILQLPAMNVCNGFSPEDLPLGMQVVGHPFDETRVLRIARAYERDTPWRERRPSLARPAVSAVLQPHAVDAASVAPARMARYRVLAEHAGLHLDDAQLAELCEAMTHVERLHARIPHGRNYADCPSTVFRHG